MLTWLRGVAEGEWKGAEGGAGEIASGTQIYCSTEVSQAPATPSLKGKLQR